MVAPEDGGKIVFQAGNNAAVDLTALVARVTDLEFRLKEANDKIDACELKTDTGSAAQQAADALALKTQQRIKDAETALSVLEGSVIKVQKVVSAMSECDKQGLHHGWSRRACVPRAAGRLFSCAAPNPRLSLFLSFFPPTPSPSLPLNILTAVHRPSVSMPVSPWLGGRARRRVHTVGFVVVPGAGRCRRCKQHQAGSLHRHRGEGDV